MGKKPIFKIIFLNQGQLYELYAQSISASSMLGFVEIEGLMFGDSTSLVIDPSEEKLKLEFNEVKRTYVPMHSIVRIDEVEKQGSAKIKPGNTAHGNVAEFPGIIAAASKSPEEK